MGSQISFPCFSATVLSRYNSAKPPTVAISKANTSVSKRSGWRHYHRKSVRVGFRAADGGRPLPKSITPKFSQFLGADPCAQIQAQVPQGCLQKMTPFVWLLSEVPSSGMFGQSRQREPCRFHDKFLSPQLLLPLVRAMSS